MSRCGTCHVVVEFGDALRDHYNSELHLTNVRRRVDGLRPLTAQEFLYSGAGGHGEDGADEAPVYSCTLCKKTFRSVQTLQTHVRSTAHLMRKEQRIIARDSDAASMLSTTSLGSAAIGLHRRHNAKRSAVKRDTHQSTAPKVSAEDRDEDVTETRCLFCGHPSKTVEANLHHLEHAHGFTIPMVTYCNNPTELLAYLARKVNGLMCLVCNEKSRAFPSLEAVRDHMRETGHERIVLSPEYQEFYNCSLADPEAAGALKLEGVRGDELVLADPSSSADTTKRVLMKRESDVPRPRQRETEEQLEKRRTIAAAEHNALALAKQEQRQIMAEQNRAHEKMMRRRGGQFQHRQLRVNQRSNHLHPKGYDGEGEVN